MFTTPELCCFPLTMHSCGSVVKQPLSLLIPLEQLMHMYFVKSLGCYRHGVY